MSYIASGGSQMPSFSPVFLNPPSPSIASRLCRSRSGHWPSNCIGRYWQTLADIFKTYLPIGRLFLFLNATLILHLLEIINSNLKFFLSAKTPSNSEPHLPTGRTIDIYLLGNEDNRETEAQLALCRTSFSCE